MNRRQLLAAFGTGSLVSSAGCTSLRDTGAVLRWVAVTSFIGEPESMEVRITDNGEVIDEATVGKDEFRSKDVLFDCRWPSEPVSYTIEIRLESSDTWDGRSLTEADKDSVGAVINVDSAGHFIHFMKPEKANAC